MSKKKQHKIKLYWMYGSYENIIKVFGDGTDTRSALDEAIEWCEKNCEIIDLVYKYKGRIVYCDECNDSDAAEGAVCRVR